MSTTSSRQYNFVDDRNSGVPITASRIDGELDNLITKLNQKVIISATAPSSPINMMIWVDTTNDLVKQYRNAEWVVMGAVHVSDTAPTTTQSGDVWIDTSASENVAKYRNQADDGWITIIDSNSSTQNQFLVPTGAMMDWPTTSAPTGWLICYGQAVSRTTYATLFGVIGTTFGVGDGSTTFNLPDYRGRTSAGVDNMGGSSANRVTDSQADSVGGVYGSESHTLSESEIPLHGHPFRTSTGASGDGSGGLMTDVSGTRTNRAAYTGALSDTIGQQIGGTGGGGSHNNVQPTIFTYKIIKI